MTTIKTVVRRDDVNGTVTVRRQGHEFDMTRTEIVDRPVPPKPKPIDKPERG